MDSTVFPRFGTGQLQNVNKQMRSFFHYVLIYFIVILNIKISMGYFINPTHHNLNKKFRTDLRNSQIKTNVIIEATSINSRKIKSNIEVNSNINNVWNVLTNYNNLSKFLPNLIQSYTLPSENNNIRLYQEGSQKILGFNFKASVILDIIEQFTPTFKKIKFSLVESSMFSVFEGEWILT